MIKRMVFNPTFGWIIFFGIIAILTLIDGLIGNYYINQVVTYYTPYGGGIFKRISEPLMPPSSFLKIYLLILLMFNLGAFASFRYSKFLCLVLFVLKAVLLYLPIFIWAEGM